MRVLRPATVAELEKELLKLGGGNHIDNMRVLSGFSNHYSVELTEDEFFNLIFLQSKEVADICPPNQDRKLRVVATRAMSCNERKLSRNWDLDLITRRTQESLAKPHFTVGPLFLRDTHGSECDHGSWYLQDGAHRALGYAIALLLGQSMYIPIRVYCSTKNFLNDEMGTGLD